MVPGAGIEPARPFRNSGFSYHYSFRCPMRFVVWTISLPCTVSVFSKRRLGRSVSSLYGARRLGLLRATDDVPTVLPFQRVHRYPDLHLATFAAKAPIEV